MVEPSKGYPVSTTLEIIEPRKLLHHNKVQPRVEDNMRNIKGNIHGIFAAGTKRNDNRLKWKWERSCPKKSTDPCEEQQCKKKKKKK